MDLNKLRDEIHANAVAKGFWDEQLSDQHCLMLVITELSEAVEADRAGKQPNIMQFENGISYPKSDFRKVYDYCIKGTVAEELADAAIRLLDLAGARGISFDDDVLSKTSIEVFAYDYCGKSFTESILHIISFISDKIFSIRFSSFAPGILLLAMLGFAKHLNIDLIWHIEQKMKYNQNRERLHGKKY